MYSLAPRRTSVMLTALCLLALGGCSSVSQTPALPELTGLAAPVVQDAQGLAVVRAAAFGARWPGGPHTWQLQPNALAVGGTELVALNDVNATVDAGVETLSPRLDYPVQFVRAGTHYVWVHGQAAAQAGLNGDSLHVGLNQQAVRSAKRITGFGGAYRWASKTMGGPVATIRVPAPGLYTLNVWMREDGVRFDGLAVSSNPAFLPTATTLVATPVAAAPAPAPAPAPVAEADPARVWALFREVMDAQLGERAPRAVAATRKSLPDALSGDLLSVQLARQVERVAGGAAAQAFLSHCAAGAPPRAEPR